MNSRAKIGTLAKTDPALLVPYGGEQRAIGELQALGVTLTPEDYRAIRQSLGGGKRGRARARELVPLECPSCESRLTHYERNGREPYFAASSESSSHGPHCDLIELAPAADAADSVESVHSLAIEEVSALPHEALHREAEQTLGAPAPVEPVRADASQTADEPTSSRARDAQTLFVIAGDPEPSVSAQWLSAPRRDDSARGEPEPSAVAHAVQLADARQLLIQGLNRALPSHGSVRYRGQEFAIVAAADLHQRNDGERVAVYGRFTECEWNPDAGRLTLKATPRTVQVWATAAAPRRLLQVESTASIEAPALAKPIPFLAFGTLRRLGPTCGIPVIRSESLVLLQALTAALVGARAEEPRASGEQLANADGLTLLPSSLASDDTALDGARGHEPLSAPSFETEAALDDDAAAADGLTALPPEGSASFGALVPTRLEPQPRERTAESDDGLPAPLAMEAPQRGRRALSTFRTLASSLRRGKSRGGPA